MKKSLPIMYWILLGVYLLYTGTHGLSFPDEGYILHTAMRIFDGQVLYRDFDFVYAPLSPLLTSFAFIIFGQSILGERLLSIGIALITTVFLYKLTSFFTKETWQKMLIVLIFVSWGPAHINFINPGMIAVSIAIGTAYLWIRWMSSRRHSFLWGVGALIFLTGLAKQNFGGALLVTGLVTALLQKECPKRFLFKQLAVGLGVSASIFSLLLLITGSFVPFVQNILTYTLKMFIAHGALNTPIDLGSGLAIPFKTFLYLSPLLIAIISALQIRSKAGVFLPLTVASFYILGIRPETDYIHLAPLLAIASLALLPLLREKGLVQKIALFMSVLLAVTGIYTSLNFPYYRWKPQLVTQNAFVADKKIMIWADEETTKEIRALKQFRERDLGSDEKIYLNYYAPMLYFILDQTNPTRFDYVGLPADLEQKLVDSLDQQQIDYVLTHPLNQLKTGVTREYIRKQYSLKEKVYGYEVWRRN